MENNLKELIVENNKLKQQIKRIKSFQMKKLLNENKIFCMIIDKKNHISGGYYSIEFGVSEDYFYTITITLKDKSKLIFRLGDICQLAKSAGAVC